MRDQRASSGPLWRWVAYLGAATILLTALLAGAIRQLTSGARALSLGGAAASDEPAAPDDDLRDRPGEDLREARAAVSADPPVPTIAAAPAPPLPAAPTNDAPPPPAEAEQPIAPDLTAEEQRQLTNEEQGSPPFVRTPAEEAGLHEDPAEAVPASPAAAATSRENDDLDPGLRNEQHRAPRLLTSEQRQRLQED